MPSQIPEDFIEEVLARTDLVSLIHSRVPLKRSGKNFSACCPFHKERTPSFSVSPDKQFYHCFGCGASGNAITFLRDYERMHFVDAVETLAKSANLEIPNCNDHTSPKKVNTRPMLAMLERASEFYCAQLKTPQNKKKAVQYLKQRQITRSVAEEFAIGYAPQGWDNLKIALIRSNAESNSALEAGLIIQNENQRSYDRFRDRIMFPIRDQRGRTIAFGGRVLGDEKPKYLNSPESPLFQKSKELYGLYEALHHKQNLKKFLIVEGYIDVIALAQHDLRFAVATLGTATSTAHLERLFRYVPEVVFCFDGDEAGRKAASRALEFALSSLKDGRQIRFLFLPEGEDPDTLVRKEGKEVFSARIETATPISDFLFEHLGKELDLETLDGKARLATLALPLLAKQPAGMLKELMLSQLAELTLIDVQTLQDQLQAIASIKRQTDYKESKIPDENRDKNPSSQPSIRRTKKTTSDETPQTTENCTGQVLTYKIIRLLLQLPEKAQLIQIPEELRELDLAHTNLLIKVLDCMRDNPNTSMAALLGYWHETPEGSKIAQLAANEFLLCDDGAELEIEEAMLQIRKLYISQAIEKQIANDRQHGSKDGAKLKRLLDIKKQLYQQQSPQ